MPDKKTILLTNDDGFHARGIKCLYDALSTRYDVTVAAPEKEQSGVSHTFTFMKPLVFREAGESDQMPGYIIQGAPADCVKFAVSTLMKKIARHHRFRHKRRRQFGDRGLLFRHGRGDARGRVLRHTELRVFHVQQT